MAASSCASGAASAPCISLYTTPLKLPSACRRQPSCSKTVRSVTARGLKTALR